MLCSETIAAYRQKPTKLCGPDGLRVRNANSGGTSIYHWEFNS